MTQNTPSTKKCKYCGETIQAVAIKCRYCGEWLESPMRTGPLVSSPPVPSPQNAAPDSPQSFEGNPSYAALMGSYMLAAIIAISAFCIIFWPVDPAQDNIRTGKIYMGIVMMLFTAGWILVKMQVLKSNFYRLTTERLEYHRGIFSRKVDNIDLFRVVDYKLTRSFVDMLLGIGTITLYTSDKSDPEFLLYKIKNPQKVFEILKSSTLSADTKRNVVHLE